MKINSKCLGLGNFNCYLFNPDSSGTIGFKNKYVFLELDVKHSERDYGSLPYSCSRESGPSGTWLTLWLPVKFKCVGWRVIIKKNALSK